MSVVQFDNAIVTHGDGSVTFGLPVLDELATATTLTPAHVGAVQLQAASSPATLGTLVPDGVYNYDTLLVELIAAAHAAHAQKRAGAITRGVARTYQATLRMQQEGRSIHDWTRLAAAIVVSIAANDPARSDVPDSMREHRERRAYAWAALALEEEVA